MAEDLQIKREIVLEARAPKLGADAQRRARARLHGFFATRVNVSAVTIARRRRLRISPFRWVLTADANFPVRGIAQDAHSIKRRFLSWRASRTRAQYYAETVQAEGLGVETRLRN